MVFFKDIEIPRKNPLKWWTFMAEEKTRMT